MSDILKEPWEVSDGWFVDGCLAVKLPSGLVFKIYPATTPGNRKVDQERIEKEVVPWLEAKVTSTEEKETGE